MMSEQKTEQKFHWLDETRLAAFSRDGYLVVPNLGALETIESMLQIVEASLNPALAPVEYEADVHYPGAPASRAAPGGDTPRRLLNALARHELFQHWALCGEVANHVRNLLESPYVQVSQNHHNCVMTKFPGYGSETGWHQDIRYWSFDQPKLVTSWLALGDEHPENGSLSVIPGSHTMDFERGQFDASLFFRTDLKKNRALMESAKNIELNAGDLLLFHSRLLHSARRNRTSKVKLSLVFTYHCESNRPIAGTRSAEHLDLDVRNF